MHLTLSVAVAAAVAWLVFVVWYPAPFWQLAGGHELFLLLISIDLVCGPVLTMVVYNPSKPRGELWRDLGVVVVLQLAALGYGLTSMWQARPLYLAFEGDRFRLVSAPDVWEEAAPERMPLPGSDFAISGPAVIGVRLLSPGDPGHLESLELAMNGVHPSFRPSRWVPYAQQRKLVLERARPVTELTRSGGGATAGALETIAREQGLPLSRLGYMPLVARHRDDWSVILDMQTGRPVGYLPVSAW